MDLPNRQSIRLKNYDYSQAGLYFITICTQKRICTLSDIRRGGALLRPQNGICTLSDSRACGALLRPQGFSRIEI